MIVWWRRVRPILVVALLCAVAAEGTARTFWRIAYGVPVRHPDRILYAFYPELQGVDQWMAAPDDGFENVLLLGGSVLHPDWGAVQAALSEQLALAGHRNVRIFNLAAPGRTSRDSWIQYRGIGGVRFALVVIYDGINDTAMNNAPPGVFRDDYGHAPWYQVVNAMAPYHRRAAFALPYTLRYVAIRAKQVLWDKGSPWPDGLGGGDWLSYGRDARSVASLTQNIGSILRLASERRDPVLLMTFASRATHDYASNASPIEIWGRADDVFAAIAQQNDAVRRLAAGTAGVRFVDQARLMAGPGPYFNDPCHLTVAGSLTFAANAVPAILDALERR